MLLWYYARFFTKLNYTIYRIIWKRYIVGYCSYQCDLFGGILSYRRVSGWTGICLETCQRRLIKHHSHMSCFGYILLKTTWSVRVNCSYHKLWFMTWPLLCWETIWYVWIWIWLGTIAYINGYMQLWLCTPLVLHNTLIPNIVHYNITVYTMTP